MLTFDQFKDSVYESIKTRPNNIRKGQQAFNFIDDTYLVARYVQFDDKIDCFYDDSKIDDFIIASYKRYYENNSPNLKRVSMN